MKLSIIIPVYNEKNTIKKIIDDVDKIILQKGIHKEILIVDDGSKDGTTEILKSLQKKPYVKIYFQNKNKGKTSAVKVGISQASGDYILIQDADLEYSPENYPYLLEPILKNNLPVVYGSRFMGRIENMAIINRIANKISNLTINILFNTHITDFHTCHKLIRKDIINSIVINSNNFSFDTEITAKILKKTIPILEIPINYEARNKTDGKKITWSNAIETYFVLFKCKFSKDK